MSDLLVQFQHHHLLSDLPRQRWTTAGKRDHLPSICEDASLSLLVRQGGHQWDGKRGAGGESNLSDWFCQDQECASRPSTKPYPIEPQPSDHHRGEMGGWGNGQAWPMIDGRWRSSLVAWWETTSPELDRVSVMAGGQPVAFPSISSSFIEFTPESWCFASQGQGRWWCVG